MELQRATRKKVKMKLAISSPTGFGKTYSALLMAFGITNDWSKIAVIDSENSSASLYAHLGEYNTIEVPPPFKVEDLEKAIKMCIAAGIEVIIVDSVYHYWQGVLDYVDQLGGGFQNWKKGTPLWQRLINLILQSPVHFICTIRKKQAYEMSKKDGKNVVEKKGMEDQVRDGFDYEMTIAFELLSENHLAKAAKDRTELFTGKQEFVITPETGKMIKEWCELGVDLVPQKQPDEPLVTGDVPMVKPPITDKAFSTAVSRIERGEFDLLAKIMDTYSLSKMQKKVLTDMKYLNTAGEIIPRVDQKIESPVEKETLPEPIKQDDYANISDDPFA